MVGTILVLLLGMSLFTVYQFGRAPTDENWFVQPPSSPYTLTPISGSTHNANGTPDLLVNGSIPAFVFLEEAGGRAFTSAAEFNEWKDAIEADEALRVTVFHPGQISSGEYRVDPSGLKQVIVRDLPQTALVAVVIEGGGSDRAGMRVGDLIYRINGRTFATTFQADSILRSGQTGKTLAYDVIRGNEVLTLHVTLANFGFPFANMVASITGLILLGVGGFIGLQKPGIRGARLLSLWFLSFGFFVSVATIQRGLDGIAASMIGGASAITASAFLPLYLHSFAWFPEERIHRVVTGFLIPGMYVLALMLVVSANFLGGTITLVVVILMITALLVGRFLLRKPGSQDSCQLTRPLDFAVLGSLILSVLIGFFLSQSPGGPGVHAGYITAAWLLIPASYLYVIGRYRLLDLNLRITRSLQYNILATGWIIALGILGLWLLTMIVQWNPDMPHIRLTGGSVEITEDAMTSEQKDQAQNTGMIILGIGGAVALWRLGRVGLDAIARRFHRARYDYRRAANDLAEVMSTRFGMQNLARGIVEKIAEIMHLKRVGILFFRDEETCCCEEAHGFDGTTWKDFCIRSEKRMTTAIQQFKGEFRIDYLPENLKQEFRKQDIQYLVPIRSKERLVGTILVGDKRSESAFLREDLEFLSSVSRQASVAIENAFLYEELAEKERIKHELQIARRIQLESLPQSTPRIAGLDISGISIPATEVGGDYFDYLNGQANRLTVVVGDVSGKGTSAALYMAKIQGILRSLNAFGLSPGELFTRTNKLLWSDLERKSFVTAFGASFDTVAKNVVLARAGHLPLFLFRHETGAVERITPRGIGLGLIGNGSFDQELEEQSVMYGQGDVFVFVTDGITEGKNAAQEEFGEQRLESVLGTSASLSAQGIRERIVDAVKTFSGGTQQHDDQTVVVVKIVP